MLQENSPWGWFQRCRSAHLWICNFIPDRERESHMIKLFATALKTFWNYLTPSVMISACIWFIYSKYCSKLITRGAAVKNVGFFSAHIALCCCSSIYNLPTKRCCLHPSLVNLLPSIWPHDSSPQTAVKNIWSTNDSLTQVEKWPTIRTREAVRNPSFFHTESLFLFVQFKRAC